MNRKTKPNTNGNLFQSLLLLLLASISGTISPHHFHSRHVDYTRGRLSHTHARTHIHTNSYKLLLLLLLRKLQCFAASSAIRGYWLRLLYNHMQHFLRLAPLLLLPEVVTVAVVVAATSGNQSSAFLGEAST